MNDVSRDWRGVSASDLADVSHRTAAVGAVGLACWCGIGSLDCMLDRQEAGSFSCKIMSRGGYASCRADNPMAMRCLVAVLSAGGLSLAMLYFGAIVSAQLGGLRLRRDGLASARAGLR